MRGMWIAAIVGLVAVVSLVFFGFRLTSGNDAKRPPINLNQLQPLPEKTADQNFKPTLKIAIASVISPMENIELYGDLLNYVGEKVEMKTQIVQRQNYSETNALIENGEVQLAFICSGAMAVEKSGEGAGKEILVTPQISGTTTYRSYIIVPAGGQETSLEQLKGKTFAYTDPLSFSGRIAPQYMVKKLGYSPDTFFSKTIFTYSHDNSIKAVAEGIVDGAAVDSLIYDLTMVRRPELRGKVKVIGQSEEVGNPPVVVASQTDPELKARLKNTLLSMHMDEKGKKAMAMVHIDRFIHPDPSLYEPVWRMAKEVGDTWTR